MQTQRDDSCLCSHCSLFSFFNDLQHLTAALKSALVSASAARVAEALIIPLMREIK